MVGQLVKLFNPLYVCSNYCFFFFENSDIPVNFCIAKLVVLKVSQGSGNLIFSLVIKKYKECACVVIYFELCSHRLLNTTNQSPSQNYVIDGISFKLTNVVRSWLGVHHHPNSYRCKHFRLSRLILLVASLTAIASSSRAIVGVVIGRRLVELLWVEESARAAVGKHLLLSFGL
jgi:hypothetical protein